MGGELRPGRPVPGTIRVYWHEASAFIAHEAEHFLIGKVSAWSLPVTANDQDRLVEDIKIPVCQTNPAGSAIFIAIDADHRETFESLVDIFAQCGWHTHRLGQFTPELLAKVDGVIIDSRRGASRAMEAVSA